GHLDGRRRSRCMPPALHLLQAARLPADPLRGGQHMSKPDQDAGIPMLTEIIPAPEVVAREDAAAEDIAELPLSSVLPPASSPLPAVAPPPAAHPVGAKPIDDWMDGEW